MTTGGGSVKDEGRAALVAGVACYLLWGFLPLYFHALALLGVGCSLASSTFRRVSAGVAGMAAVAAFALPFKLNIVVAIAAAVALCLMLEHLQPPAAPFPSTKGKT